MPYESRFRIEWNDSVALESGTCFDEFLHIEDDVLHALPLQDLAVQIVHDAVPVEQPHGLRRGESVLRAVRLDAEDLELQRIRCIRHIPCEWLMP